MSLQVSFLYGGLLALFTTALGMNVTRLRATLTTFVGTDAPPKRLQVAIRAHGNAAEWAPLGIVLLVLLELGGVSAVALHWLGGGLLLGRVAHGVGFLAGPKGLAAVGATIVYLVMTVLSGWVLALHFMH